MDLGFKSGHCDARGLALLRYHAIEPGGNLERSWWCSVNGGELGR